jgi:hypothetical protein
VPCSALSALYGLAYWTQTISRGNYYSTFANKEYTGQRN